MDIDWLKKLQQTKEQYVYISSVWNDEPLIVYKCILGEYPKLQQSMGCQNGGRCLCIRCFCYMECGV